MSDKQKEIEKLLEKVNDDLSNKEKMFVLGVIIGLIGLIGMGINYPVYKKILVRGKQKYAFEIMELAKEISDEE